MTRPRTWTEVHRFTLTQIELNEVLKLPIDPVGDRERFILVAATTGANVLVVKYAVIVMSPLDPVAHPNVWEVYDSGLLSHVQHSPRIQALGHHDGPDFSESEILQLFHGVPVNMTLPASWMMKLGWR